MYHQRRIKKCIGKWQRKIIHNAGGAQATAAPRLGAEALRNGGDRTFRFAHQRTQIGTGIAKAQYPLTSHVGPGTTNAPEDETPRHLPNPAVVKPLERLYVQSHDVR